MAPSVLLPGGPGAAAPQRAWLKPLELADKPAVDLLAMLAATVNDVDRAVRATSTDDNQPATTLTAILPRGSQLALIHIGDTRVYLLRGGELSQLTQDHTWVQSQVDYGKLSPDQAAAHPQRALLTRALGAGSQPIEADLALRTALAGDRYLLCSDGLSAVVNRSDLRTALAETGEPEPTAQRLIDLAYAAGAPDNIACIVVDIIATQQRHHHGRTSQRGVHNVSDEGAHPFGWPGQSADGRVDRAASPPPARRSRTFDVSGPGPPTASRCAEALPERRCSCAPRRRTPKERIHVP
jgi:serine/threonine protein phosphatase PrpC